MSSVSHRTAWGCLARARGLGSPELLNSRLCAQTSLHRIMNANKPQQPESGSLQSPTSQVGKLRGRGATAMSPGRPREGQSLGAAQQWLGDGASHSGPAPRRCADGTSGPGSSAMSDNSSNGKKTTSGLGRRGCTYKPCLIVGDAHRQACPLDLTRSRAACHGW